MATTQKIQPTTANPAAGTNSLYNQDSPWQRMLTQMLLSQRMGSRGMAGFALGQILASLLKDWRTRYDQRDGMRDELEPLTPEERAQWLDKKRQQSPRAAADAEEFMRQRGFDIAQTQPQALDATQPQITPQVSQPISQAAQQLMPSTDFLQQQGLLGTADDWQKYLAAFGGGGRGF